jgi:hypothetical protein
LQYFVFSARGAQPVSGRFVIRTNSPSGTLDRCLMASGMRSRWTAGPCGGTAPSDMPADRRRSGVADRIIGLRFLSTYSVRNPLEMNLKVICNHCYPILD